MKALGGLLGKKNQQAEVTEEEIHLTETMLIDELSPDLSNKFYDVFMECESNSNRMLPDEVDSIASSLMELSEQTKKVIFGPLTSLANKIDNGKESVDRFSTDLEGSKSDLSNASHHKSTPTPFINRMFDHLQNQYNDLAQQLAANESKFTLSSETLTPYESLAKALREQNEALIRCSTKVAKLRSQYESTKKLFNDRFGQFSRTVNIDDSISSSSTVAETVTSTYKTWESERKQKLDKYMEDIDLFGVNTVAPQTQAKKSILGGKIFGNKTSSATPSKNPSTRPSSGTPAPKA